MTGYCYLKRRSDSPLIDLDAQDVFCLERSVVEPLVPVAVQIQNRFFKILGNLVERIEKVIVNFRRLCMAEDHKAADLFAETLQV